MKPGVGNLKDGSILYYVDFKNYYKITNSDDNFIYLMLITSGQARSPFSHTKNYIRSKEELFTYTDDPKEVNVIETLYGN